MRVLIIEKAILLCFIYNALLLFLNSYINHRKNYGKMVLVAIIFTMLDIISLYIGNIVLYCIFMTIFIALPIFFSKANYGREILIVCGLVFLCVGLHSIIPITNMYMNVLVVLGCIILSGIIPIIGKNNYIHTTLAHIRFPNGQRVSALIDTGIISENAPMVIIKHSQLNSMMMYLPDINKLDVGTVRGYGNMSYFVLPIIEVIINGKKQYIHNVTIAISYSDLPWDALISAQGLV